jgi:hypothetical protein
MSCLSCKNQVSNERCKRKAIINGLCKLHYNSKSLRLWHDVANIQEKVVLISAAWRGYTVRSRLRLAGKHGETVNDEDPFTLETKNEVHPFDFFSFEEDGKLFWFHVTTLIRCLFLSNIPTNPYTRQPLSIEARRRIRKLYMYRIRNHLPVGTIPPKHRWFEICQILFENDMPYIEPEFFTNMTTDELYFFVNALLRNFMTDKVGFKYLYWIQNAINKFYMESTHDYCSQTVATTILTILHNVADPYTVCKNIVSSM